MPHSETETVDLQKVFTVAPDYLSDANIHDIVFSIGEALAEGYKRIVLSVENGFITNKIAVSRLLMKCVQAVRTRGGRLYLIERRTPEKSDYRTICSVLNIPIYFDNGNPDAGDPLDA